MHDATRSDGSHYLVSSKPTYYSVGWAPPEDRGPLIELLRSFVDAIAGGLAPETLAGQLPEQMRAAALSAQSLIGRFEALAPEPSLPQLETGVWTPQHPEKCNIGIFRRQSSQGADGCDLADQVARALAQVLLDAGARDVMWGTLD